MTKNAIRDLTLWIAVLAGPVFWLFSFEAKFSWTPWACAAQTKLALFAFTGVAFLLSAGAGVLAWRQWRRLANPPPDEVAVTLARSRFMALGGMVFSIGFCLVILAQAIPDFLLEACQ